MLVDMCTSLYALVVRDKSGFIQVTFDCYQLLVVKHMILCFRPLSENERKNINTRGP